MSQKIVPLPRGAKASRSISFDCLTTAAGLTTSQIDRAFRASQAMACAEETDAALARLCRTWDAVFAHKRALEQAIEEARAATVAVLFESNPALAKRIMRRAATPQMQVS